MQSKRFPDGALVELAWSDNSVPPDCERQAQTKSSLWFRVDGGEWEPAGRSLHRAWEAMHVAGTVAEFREYLEGL